jgi:hypothetical protein
MRSRVILFGLFVVFCSMVGKADQIPAGDPIIKTGGRGTGALHPLGLEPALVPTIIITPNFIITSPTGNSPGTSSCVLMQGILKNSSPDCSFENGISNNGVPTTITSLIFDAPTINPSTVNCGFLTGSPFASCDVDPLTGGGTQVTFSDGSIPFHTDFTLDFEGFPPNTSFGTTAAVPEPGTFELLLIGGLAAAFAWIRMRTKG